MSGSEAAALAGAVIGVLGGICAVLGAWLAIRESRARSKGVHTTGTVVANVYGGGHARSGQPLFEGTSDPDAIIQIRPRQSGYPKVKFTTAAGDDVTFTSSIGSYPLTHKVGDTVPLYYDRDDPQRAEIVGEGRVFFVLLTVFGVVMAAIGMAMRVFSRG